MIKKLTYKERFITATAIVVLFIVICYSVTVKKTIQVISDYNVIKKEVFNSDNTIKNILILKNDINNLEGKINSFNSSGKDMQDKIVKNIAFFCEQNSLYIKGIVTPQELSGKGRKVLETRIITVKGGYYGIVKLAYFIEQKFGIGRISSLHFYVQQNNQTNSKELFAEIYLQNVVS